MDGQLPDLGGRAPLFFVDRYTWPTKYRILILGQTDSGKTYLAKRLLDQKYGDWPIVVYQSKPRVRSLDKLVAERPRNIAELSRYFRGTKRPPLTIFKPLPDVGHLRETTEAFARLMLYCRGPVLVYIDEVSHFTQFSPLPAPMFAALITQGRELDKGVIMAAQEPAYLPRFIYAESQVIIKMYLHGAVNLKAVRDKCPLPLAVTPTPTSAHGLVLWDIRDKPNAYPFRRCV